MSEYSLEVEGLAKSFRMYRSPFRRITEVLSRGKFKGHEEFWALQDVNLHGMWFCDVKASGCCIASVDQWPPANGDRFHCLRGCNF